MAVTLASIITNFNTYVGDSSEDRITNAERYQLATEAAVWLQEEIGNDHMVRTYALDYFDNIHYYPVTTEIASLLEGADLRRSEKDQYYAMSRISPRELAEDIGQQSQRSVWAIERRDLQAFLGVNHVSKYQPSLISSMESITNDGGEWELDEVNSDATNLTVDNVEYKQGTGSLNFDVDVSQSGNNRATLSNSALTARDLSAFEDLGSWVFWAYIPDASEFSSITVYWGSSSTNYWSATVTTDAYGSDWANGWNRIRVDWADATRTLAPDAGAITYMRFDFNYGAGQTDDTDFRIDDITMVRPERLVFHYTSWYVGRSSGGTDLTAFSAETDVPFFSGQYDQYKYAIAHKMASVAFYGPFRNQEMGGSEEVLAIRALNRVKKLIPSSVVKEEKAFKVGGVSFRRGRRGRRN
jgi:hypothetical protein